jgi:hypothetical protein
MSLFSNSSPVVRSFANTTPIIKGTKGDTGLVGATGAKGDTGVAGAVGATGAKGDTGLVGATGAKGDTGVAGAVGATSAKGDTGVAGAVGATGAKGDIGATGAKGDSNYDTTFLNATIITSGAEFRIFKRYASLALMKNATLLTSKYYIIHNPTNLAENGQLYYNSPTGVLSNICNLYALTGGGQFVDGTTTLNISKTQPVSSNTFTTIGSLTLQTCPMNYIIATEGIYPPRK